MSRFKRRPRLVQGLRLCDFKLQCLKVIVKGEELSPGFRCGARTNESIGCTILHDVCPFLVATYTRRKKKLVHFNHPLQLVAIKYILESIRSQVGGFQLRIREDWQPKTFGSQ